MYLHRTSVQCDMTCPALILQAFACPCLNNHFTKIARKVMRRRKNARLQFKEQNMAKFKTLSRAEMSPLEVRRRTVD